MEALAYDLPITVEEYLAGEEKAPIRHEYLDGHVRAMAGETKRHNRLTLRLASRLSEHCGDGPCQTYAEGVKVYPLAKSISLFYYPDVMISCDPRDIDERFCRYPKLLIEVTSESTEDIDRGEKLIAYLQNETLEEYAIVAQTRPEVSIYRRAEEWQRKDLSGWDATLELRSVGLDLTLRELYAGLLV
jgi:Uma2 family endonuclease